MKNQSPKNKTDLHVSEGYKPILNWSIAKIDLLGKKEYKFDKVAENRELKELTKLLQIQNILSFKFKGSIFHESQNDVRFKLMATLSATTVQNCVITLQPIRKKNLISVERWFSNANKRQTITNSYVKTPMENVDTLENEVRLHDIALEELVLELPDYPRKPNAKFAGITVTEKGITELKDNSLKPFAALSVLKNTKSTN